MHPNHRLNNDKNMSSKQKLLNFNVSAEVVGWSWEKFVGRWWDDSMGALVTVVDAVYGISVEILYA